MEITIGVRDIQREISLEVDGDADSIAAEVSAALAQAGTGTGAAVLDLTDTKGNRVIVPASTLAYVQIGAQEARRVGFGTA